MEEVNQKFTSALRVVLILFVALHFAVASGLRINGTHSFPVGFYFASHKRPEKGDLVFVSSPPLPLFALAKDRGYLNVAYSPTPHLVKRLAGVAGDRVTIDSAGVEVNGIRLANSTPSNCDSAGPAIASLLTQRSHFGSGRGPPDVGLQSCILRLTLFRTTPNDNNRIRH